jgi:hypothetical protein
MGIPSDLASSLREIIQPSLFESTTTGTPIREGSKTLSHEQKKLLQSTNAILLLIRFSIRCKVRDANCEILTPSGFKFHFYDLNVDSIRRHLPMPY